MKISAQFAPYYSSYNIQPNKQSQKPSTPSFGSTARFNVMSPYVDYLYTTASNMFKPDIDWLDFAGFLDVHFADKQKVNVVCQACADGSEPYTMAIALIEMLGEERAAKFLPIRAFDIDKENIQNAQTGLINLLESDIKTMKLLNIDVDKYFEPTSNKLVFAGDELQDRVKTYRVKPILTNNVVFERESISATLNTMEDNSDTVFLCRNVIPHLGSYDSRKTIEKIGKTLKEGSIFSMGNYINNNFSLNSGDRMLIKDSGFEELNDTDGTYIKVCNGLLNTPDKNYFSRGDAYRLYLDYGIEGLNM